MAPSEVHEVSRILGNLESAVREQSDALKDFKLTWREQDDKATEGRKRLYESFDELKDSTINRMGAVEYQVSTLAADVQEMKPAIADLRLSDAQTKAYASGAITATKLWARIFYGIIGGAVASIIWA